MNYIEEFANYSPPLVLLHIPKTAGQALIVSLLKNYSPSDSLALYLPPDPVEGFEYQLGSTKAPRFIAGHFSYGVPERVVGMMAYRYITFLRHPYARIISQYLFDRDYFFNSTLEFEQTTKEQIFSIEPVTFINENNLVTHDNFMTRMVSGIGSSIPLGGIDSAVLEMAKTNLSKFFFIGFQEHYADSVEKMGGKLGIKLKENQKNKVRADLLNEVMNDDIIKKISKPSDRNIFDLQLYYWALQNFYLRK